VSDSPLLGVFSATKALQVDRHLAGERHVAGIETLDLIDEVPR
jgi:hypothetical protein